jgi:3-keto-5-aminohexanoate cleavage enzyme
MQRMEPLIIEARVNEYATRNRNKNVPWLPHEIARDATDCFEAGASIVHFHGRAADGAPDNRFETCRDTIAGIRQASPILVHPSLGYLTTSSSLEERFSVMDRLTREAATRPDFAPMDMGSVNADLYDDRAPSFRSPGSVYLNRTDMLLGLAEKMREARIKPSLVAWNVSFVRLIGAFLDMSLLDAPLYVSLVLTDKILISGHPGTAVGLDAYLAFLPRSHPLAWAVTYIGGSMDHLLDKIILAGGHVQVGLGDYPHGENGSPTNAQIIADVVKRAKNLGRPVASVYDAQRMLRLPGRDS